MKVTFESEKFNAIYVTDELGNSVGTLSGQKLNFVSQIPELLKRVYNAGRNGESIIIEENDDSDNGYTILYENYD